jgi:hypothetical protein
MCRSSSRPFQVRNRKQTSSKYNGFIRTHIMCL